jgi:FkbM family methyltransferase
MEGLSPWYTRPVDETSGVVVTALTHRAIMHARFGLRRTAYKALGKDQPYVIEGVKVVLPAEHRLPYYQAVFPQYDRYFVPILRALAASRETVLVDVGANVGDTAIAAARASEHIQVVAVEGNPYFVDYLRRNVSSFQDRVQVVDSFVGPLGDAVNYAHDGSTGGFVTGAGSTQAEDGEPHWVSVDSLVEEPAELRIWKSDTDGFDVHLAVHNWDTLLRTCGVLWLEYDPALAQGDPSDLVKLGELLAESGRTVWFFDNVGNRMASARGAQVHPLLSQLTSWLRAQRRGVVAVPYLDLWVFDDASLDAVSSLQW